MIKSFSIKGFNVKNFNIMFLAVCMMFGLTACGEDTKISNVSMQGRLNESQAYYAMELEINTASDSTGTDFKGYGPNIYYPEGQAIKVYSISGRQTNSDTYAWADAPGAWVFEEVSYNEAGEVYGLVILGGQKVSDVDTADKAGTGAVAGIPHLCKFDTARNLVFARDLTEYVQETKVTEGATGNVAETETTRSGIPGKCKLEVGTDGRIYISNSTGIWIFEGDGSYKGEVFFEGIKNVTVLDFIGDADRNLYVLYEDGEKQNQCVAEIDTEKGAVKNVQQTIGLTGLGTTAMDGDILGFNQAAAYLYSREECALYELFHWTECKIDGNGVCGLHFLEDGRVFAAAEEAGGAIASFLVRGVAVSGSRDSQSGKIDIVIGHGGENTLLLGAVNRFNRENEKYNVVLKNYSWVRGDEQSMARLDEQYASGEGPDLLDLGAVDVESLVEYGYLEDLSLYLEGSGAISEGDFLEFALEEYRADGMLLAIPHHFEMSLMMANSDFMGTEPGWTLEEALTLLEESGETRVFAKEMRRQDMFEYLLYMNESLFVDRKAGTCDFDNELFRRIVDLAEEYPTKYKSISDKEREPIGLYELEDGSGIICQVTGRDFQCLQPYEGALAGKINYIGYPDEEGTGISACEVYDAFGISSLSDCKEGAWEFLEYYIQYVSTEKHAIYFPTYRPAIQSLVNWTMESGLRGATGLKGYGYEMWLFEHYLPDQEEMDIFCEVLERARPACFEAEFLEIVLEQVDRYYAGDADLDEVIASIEQKIGMLLAE